MTIAGPSSAVCSRLGGSEAAQDSGGMMISQKYELVLDEADDYEHRHASG